MSDTITWKQELIENRVTPPITILVKSSSCSVTGTAFYIVVLVILYTLLQSITYYRHRQYLRTLDDKALCSFTLGK